jgi:hypothetical protein
MVGAWGLGLICEGQRCLGVVLIIRHDIYGPMFFTIFEPELWVTLGARWGFNGWSLRRSPGQVIINIIPQLSQVLNVRTPGPEKMRPTTTSTLTHKETTEVNWSCQNQPRLNIYYFISPRYLKQYRMPNHTKTIKTSYTGT